MSEIELRDSILRHSLQLQRLSAGEAARAEAILRELEAELRLLLQSDSLSAAAKVEIEALVRDADELIGPTYDKLAKVVDTKALAIIVAERTVADFGEALATAVAMPTAERLASLADDVLIEGSPLSEWWEGQKVNLKRDFAAQVRQGVIAGETNERIVRRLAGGRDEPGVMTIARRHARTLVHSSVMASANEARLAVFRKNADVLSGVRWLSTLDSHTCLRCGVLDGKVWNLDGKPKGHDSPFAPAPLHSNCRCVLSPQVKGFSGTDGSRASSEGQVPATTTFEDFLKRQSPDFVERTLGKRRADMFRAGKLTLRDLISGTGRALTLDQLAEAI